MRIFRDSITQLAREGYRTTQIPQIAINLPTPTPHNQRYGFTDEELASVRNIEQEYEEIPDEWIAHVHSSCRRYCVTDRERRSAFWHLSRVGFEANREAIRQAFEGSQYKRGTWEEFLEDIEREWQRWDAGTERHIANLRRKLQEIERERNV